MENGISLSIPIISHLHSRLLALLKKVRDRVKKAVQINVANKIQLQKKTELEAIPEEESAKKPKEKAEEERKIKVEKTKLDFTYEEQNKENNSSLSNFEELPLVNWYDQHYKQKSKLIPKLPGEKTTLTPVRASYAVIEKKEPYEPSERKVVSIMPEPEFVLPEKELENRLAQYQQLLDEFNIGKVKLKKLKSQSETFSNASLANEISKTQAKLQEKRSQIQDILQEITLLKQSLKD